MPFFANDNKINSVVDNTSKLPLEAARRMECRVCTLRRCGAVNSDMPPSGSEEPILYFLGEAPGEDEDAANKPFVGRSGKYLKGYIPGFRYRRDNEGNFVETFDIPCRFNNIVRTRPPGNRDPEEFEIECCRNSVEADIARTKPSIIVGLGRHAFKWTDLGDNGSIAMSAIRGSFYPVEIAGHRCLFMPTFHPAAVLRAQNNYGKSGFELAFERDVDRAFKAARFVQRAGNDRLVQEAAVYWEKGDPADGIECVYGLKSDREMHKVLAFLDWCLKQPYVAVDIETNRLRPIYRHAEILTVAVGTYEQTMAFPLSVQHYNCWTPEQLKKIDGKLRELLISPSTQKIAHNQMFELEWFAWRYGLDIANGAWDDTWCASYVMDTHQGIHSLDFNIRRYFGFWLKPLSNIDRSRMEDYTLPEVLPYNGLDTKWTYRLFNQQMQILDNKKGQLAVYADRVATGSTLVKMQLRGMPVNAKVVAEIEQELTTRLAEISTQVSTMTEVAQFDLNEHKPFNIASPAQVNKLISKYMGRLDLLQREEKGRVVTSTDDTAMNKVAEAGLPIGQLVLEHRALDKKLGTYITPMPKYLSYTGLVHTAFHPYRTATMRLSSSAPNVQNFPKRKGKEIRRIVQAPSGYTLVAADYGQIEARVIACAAQDEYFVNALWDDYDVHMQWAEKLARVYPDIVGGKQFINDKAALKKLRGAIKTIWVFSAFYGSSLRSIANGIGVPDRLLAPLFEEFWDTFAGVKQWQKWIQAFYEKFFYVETLSGRRRYGPMSLNEMTNGPIQNQASQICEAAMRKLDAAGIEIILNVHDDATSLVPTSQLDNAIETIAKCMCDVSEFKFLNVPITVEVAVGANWAEMEEIAVFNSKDFYNVPRNLRAINDYRKFWD